MPPRIKKIGRGTKGRLPRIARKNKGFVKPHVYARNKEGYLNFPFSKQEYKLDNPFHLATDEKLDETYKKLRVGNVESSISFSSLGTRFHNNIIIDSNVNLRFEGSGGTIANAKLESVRFADSPISSDGDLVFIVEGGDVSFQTTADSSYLDGLQLNIAGSEVKMGRYVGGAIDNITFDFAATGYQRITATDKLSLVSSAGHMDFNIPGGSSSKYYFFERDETLDVSNDFSSLFWLEDALNCPSGENDGGETDEIYSLIRGKVKEHDTEGFDGTNFLEFKKFKGGNITAFSNYGGTVAGTVKATDATHGLVDGDVIKITESTNFNGTSFTVTTIDANEFYFTDTWVDLTDETGVWNNVNESSRYNLSTEGAIEIMSDKTAYPLIALTSTKNHSKGGVFQFIKKRQTRWDTVVDGIDGDVLGNIVWDGYDDGTPAVNSYATLHGYSQDTEAGAEKGRLLFSLANDGSLEKALQIDASLVSASNCSSTVFGSIFLKEQGGAELDVAGYGQLHVRNNSPNTLYFTDDIGNDERISNGGQYQYESKICNYSSTVTGNYIPLVGYVIERTTLTNYNEYLCMVAPYDGEIIKILYRTENTSNGNLEIDIYESPDATEVPGVVTGTKDVLLDHINRNITQDISFASMTSGVNTLTKGKIYAIKITSPSAPNDTNVTVVFKWDVTS